MIGPRSSLLVRIAPAIILLVAFAAGLAVERVLSVLVKASVEESARLQAPPGVCTLPLPPGVD